MKYSTVCFMRAVAASLPSHIVHRLRTFSYAVSFTPFLHRFVLLFLLFYIVVIQYDGRIKKEKIIYK